MAGALLLYSTRRLQSLKSCTRRTLARSAHAPAVGSRPNLRSLEIMAKFVFFFFAVTHLGARCLFTFLLPLDMRAFLPLNSRAPIDGHR